MEQYGLKPQKGLGQNFLVDTHILQKIIHTAHIEQADTVVEVGPGLGILTQTLAKEAKQVIAVEKDPQMVAILQKILRNFKNIEIVQGDILDIRLPRPRLPQLLAGSARQAKYKVVANLPYYITSPVIRKFLEAEQKPGLMVLMVQKEVAQRICAKPPKMSLLAVSVQLYGTPEIISYVKKTSFWPRPNVDSAIIRINIRPEQMRRTAIFFKIVRAGFKQPRKQLAGNLAIGLGISKETAGTWLTKNNIQPAQRAETLALEDWKKLAESFHTL